MPTNTILLAPDTSIITASEVLLRSTYNSEKSVKDRGLFEVFPPPPGDPMGPERLSESLTRVMESRRVDIMAAHRYDIPRPKSLGGGFEERYWQNVNYPIFDRKGKLLYIVMSSEDVTRQTLQARKGIH